MFRRRLLYPLCSFSLPLLFAVCAQAALSSDTHTIKVGVHIDPPFVMQNQSGHYYGLAVDLWEMADERLGLETEYIAYPSFKALIEAAVSGEVDMLIGNIATTYERTKNLKFSHPWYDTGLRIMIKGALKPSLWEEMKKSGQLENYFWIALLLAALAVGQALLRRRMDPEFPKTWLEGLSYSLYELILAARLGIMQRNFLGWFGYIILTAWMIFGVAMVAYVVSSITNAMTISSFRAESMNSLAYLPGQRVGVLSGTVGEQYLRRIKVAAIPFNSFSQALEALEKGELDVVVDDAPVLEYWAHRYPPARLDVVGPLFCPGKYAFAANKSQARLIDRVSEELIRLHETGALEMLQNKYLGKREY